MPQFIIFLLEKIQILQNKFLQKKKKKFFDNFIEIKMFFIKNRSFLYSNNYNTIKLFCLFDFSFKKLIEIL